MLMPRALELFDLEEYDLVISSESGPAKGVITKPHIPHFCYCHSPMRYLWDRYHEYRSNLGFVSRAIFDQTAHRMRVWDAVSANLVDHYIANSRFVSGRIEKYYRRESSVIHPPVDIDRFTPAVGKGSYYLFVSELVKYKRADLAVEAFAEIDRPLLVVGDGPERSALESIAPPNVEFLGRVSDARLAELYQGARALVFPGVEDFGIVPLEAMASGRPVIALQAGGACDTVVEGVTGLFFRQQTPAALIEAVERFETEFEDTFETDALVAHARTFSPERFKEKFLSHLVEREPKLTEFLFDTNVPNLRTYSRLHRALQ